MSGLVTVVVTNYNAGRYLKEAVKSVLDQTYSKWRMIIVDDASSDDSIDKIQGYLTDPRIRLIVNDRNIGQTKSLNRALKHVHTPWMVQLDSDDWFAPHTLEVLVHEAKHSKPDVGLIGANIELVWQDDGDRTVRHVSSKVEHFEINTSSYWRTSLVGPGFTGRKPSAKWADGLRTVRTRGGTLRTCEFCTD